MFSHNAATALLVCALWQFPICISTLPSEDSSLNPRLKDKQKARLGIQSVVAHESDSPEMFFLSMPSIVKLDNGNLMTVYERESRAMPATSIGKVTISSDGGKTWTETCELRWDGQHHTMNHPLRWPQVFKTKSGVYIIGVHGVFSVPAPNDLIITKMLDTDGREWSQPKFLTSGLTIVTANTGVDVSGGRVTKAFEVFQQMSSSDMQPTAKLRQSVNIEIPPVQRDHNNELVPAFIPPVTVPVDAVDKFVVGTMVVCDSEKTDMGSVEVIPIYFRVLEVRKAEMELVLRPEYFNEIFAEGTRVLKGGSTVGLRMTGFRYGGVDWISQVMSAPDDADLTDRNVWTFSNLVGNPISMYPHETMNLLGVNYLADKNARDTQLYGLTDNIKAKLDVFSDAELQKMGFGSLYFLEGVAIRLRDEKGGDNSIQVILRIDNNLQCSMGAIVNVVEKKLPDGKMELHAEFLRITWMPGLSVAHPAIIYDEETDLYWYVNNVIRDSAKRWNRRATMGKGLRVTRNSYCAIDRTSLGLFYSQNAIDFHFAGIIQYQRPYHLHYTYPHMITDGADLVIVVRANTGSNNHDNHGSVTYNNHDSDSVVLFRVPSFRSLADLEWMALDEPKVDNRRHTDLLADSFNLI